jgi:hypothetical protein
MKKATRARYALEFKEEAVRLVNGANGFRLLPGTWGWRSRRCIIESKQPATEA